MSNYHGKKNLNMLHFLYVYYDCIFIFYDTKVNYDLDFVLDWIHDIHSHCVHKTVIKHQT